MQSYRHAVIRVFWFGGVDLYYLGGGTKES